ncbi:MAG: DNA repair ATPase [Planctomycetes bacterium]|nr:DNA repair ATPase [Planctomycetota bacterium]
MATDDGLDTGNYDVLRARLDALGRELAGRAEALNARRKAVFGGTELQVIGNERIRTENNCVPRDIVTAGGFLVIAYNVFIGMRTETRVQDVFSIQRFGPGDEGGFQLAEVPLGTLPGFLDHAEFQREFAELYRYYKGARLAQLRSREGKVLAVFQTGATAKDLRVFRWSLDRAQRPTYIDARGERDHVYPPPHDFVWTATTREDHVKGRHPHVSILDEVFVEAVGGDLTIKVEDNTEDGLGIYREPVQDPNQSLDDGQIHYAKLGSLILLKVLPFGEQQWRYFVFNTRTKHVLRADAIGQSCVQLPEDHGVVFPGGYYLQTGAHKVYDQDPSDLEFERSVKAPNGEDVLYVFHRRGDCTYLLFPYNMIRREVQTPIHCHGWTLLDDGTLLSLRQPTPEPSRVHGLQIWRTPFTSAEFAAQAPTDGSYLAKVGNAELVRGISDALAIARLLGEQRASRALYEDLAAAATRTVDAYHWLGHEEAGDLLGAVQAVRQNAELIIDEFEKVLLLRRRADEAVAEAVARKEALEAELRPDDWAAIEPFLDALTRLRGQRGQLISLRELKFMDLARVDALEAEVAARFDDVSKAAVEFLLREGALGPIGQELEALLGRIEAAKLSTELRPLGESLETQAQGLTVLTETIGGLQVDDPTQRTRVLEVISEALGHVNRVRATFQARRKELLSAEGRDEFAAQFRLFGQAVASALAVCDTPERCDEQLSRLMLQLEELEGRFGEFDRFMADLAEKREEVYEAFDARRQALTDERQRRAQTLMQAADRMAQGVARKAATFKTQDELHGYFASDAMVAKLRQVSAQLLELGDSVKADEVASRLKTVQQEAVRGLRDKLELYDGSGAPVIRLGRHRFNVNTQPVELTLVPHDAGLGLHVTGTDYHEAIDDPAFADTKPFWSQQVVSETEEVYRGEYLAYCLLTDAEEGKAGLSLADLTAVAHEPERLLERVRAYAADRYDEGYERGLHDADAARILEKLLSMRATAGLLRFPPGPRALACMFWAHGQDDARGAWHRRAVSLGRLREAFGQAPALDDLGRELARALEAFAGEHGLPVDHAGIAGRYLVEELTCEAPRFTTGADAAALVQAFEQRLDDLGRRGAFKADLEALAGRLGEQHALTRAWLEAFLQEADDAADRAPALPEAVALLLAPAGALAREVSSARTHDEVTGLLGQHPRVSERRLPVRLDELLARVGGFRRERVPAFRAYRRRVKELLERERARLRLDELSAKPLTTFVRNRLIDEVYLPLIGDNLAKQLGALGEGKRTDLMGLLLLISPPGYGKTTLMEWVASRLGLVFVKVNGPALGHSVTSLDPAEAPSATARQEVEKIDLALEMGNNVMLYLDDVQHTSPELLQKFISLCDAQRRIEGVWKGRTRTYDLRGKKFCVVMAGNPYTETGGRFQIPDMLANRADTYNLGDVLSGKEELFALSYLENSLTSNPVLAPLAGRDPQDVHRLVRRAKGEEVATTDLTHPYSGVELQEIEGVMRKLFRVQQVLLEVNRLYIASAAQEDAYRTEPPFKLQGSYRNMNKISEKVASAMNDAELERLIEDHYQGEAQTLTTGAEQNLLKLAELRGALTVAQRARWAEVKRGFERVKLGGGDDDPAARLAGLLGGVGERLAELRDLAARVAERGGEDGVAPRLDAIARALAAPQPIAVRVEQAPVPVDALVARFEELTKTVSQPRLSVKLEAPPQPLDALVGRLEQLVATVSRPTLDVRVEQQPLPVADLVRQQAALFEQTLVPTAERITRGIEDQGRFFQRLTEIVEQLTLELGRRVFLRPPKAKADGEATG